MGAVQIAAIRSALLNLVDAQERELPRAADLCAMLCVAGREEQWVQLLLGTLNFGYPHDEDPLEFLKRYGVAAVAGLTLDAFEPKRYATLTLEPCAIDDLARFIDRLLIAIYALPEGYGVSVERQYLAEGTGTAAQRNWYLAMPSRWPNRAVVHALDGAAPAFREPALDTDLWELASAEHRNRRSEGAFGIPPIEQRDALEHGDLANLLFTILTDDDDGEAEVVEERMWALVTERRGDHFLGRLVNQPVSVDSRRHYLTQGAEIPFRSEHVVEIRRWEPSDIDDFLANTLHRRWA
jgi:hypothetical protein